LLARSVGGEIHSLYKATHNSVRRELADRNTLIGSWCMFLGKEGVQFARCPDPGFRALDHLASAETSSYDSRANLPFQLRPLVPSLHCVNTCCGHWFLAVSLSIQLQLDTLADDELVVAQLRSSQLSGSWSSNPEYVSIETKFSAQFTPIYGTHFHYAPKIAREVSLIERWPARKPSRGTHWFGTNWLTV
jgi:hypothetical protein